MLTRPDGYHDDATRPEPALSLPNGPVEGPAFVVRPESKKLVRELIQENVVAGTRPLLAASIIGCHYLTLSSSNSPISHKYSAFGLAERP